MAAPKEQRSVEQMVERLAARWAEWLECTSVEQTAHSTAARTEETTAGKMAASTAEWRDTALVDYSAAWRAEPWDASWVARWAQ